MKNWKTTLAGLFGALAVWAAHQPGTIGVAGNLAMVVTPVIAGLVAKDVNVTGGTVKQ